MAYALVKSGVNTYGTDLSDSTQTVSWSGGGSASAGNLLIAVMRLSSDETTTVNAPSGFTLARSFTHSDAGLNARGFIWYKVAAGGETGVTFTTGSNTSQNVELAIGEFSGNDTSAPFDVYAENLATGGTTTHASGDLTGTTATDDWLKIVVLQADAGSRTFTPSTATAWPSGSNSQGVIAYRIGTVATNLGESVTSSGFTDVVMGVCAFKASAGGGAAGQPTAKRFGGVPGMGSGGFKPGRGQWGSIQ